MLLALPRSSLTLGLVLFAFAMPSRADLIDDSPSAYTVCQPLKEGAACSPATDGWSGVCTAQMCDAKDPSQPAYECLVCMPAPPVVGGTGPASGGGCTATGPVGALILAGLVPMILRRRRA